MRGTYTSSVITKLKIPLLFLGLGFIFYCIPAFLRSPFYPDEIRNIYITQHIKTPDNFFFPQYLEGIYYHKPPLYFWITKGAYLVHAANPLVVPVLFNVIVAAGIMMLNYIFLKKEGASDVGLTASLLLCTTGIFYGMSSLLRMDILFLFFIYAAIVLFWHGVHHKKKHALFAAAGAGFLAVFTKGAFGLLFPLLVMAGLGFLRKDKRIVAQAVGVTVLAALLCAAWIMSFSQIRPEYFAQMVLKQTVARGINPVQHQESFFFYLPFLFLVFLPWSILGAGYFCSLRNKTVALWEKLFILWFWGGFLILSLVKSKLPMYLLLLSIPFCGLTAQFIKEGKEKFKSVLLHSTAFFFVAAWIGAFLYYSSQGEAVPVAAFILLGVFLLMAAALWKVSFQQKVRRFFVCWSIALIILGSVLFPFASNQSRFKKLADTVTRVTKAGDVVYVKDKSLLPLQVYNLSFSIRYVNSYASLPHAYILVAKHQEAPERAVCLVKSGEFSIFQRKQ